MLICQCNAMHRRDVMCGGGAAMFSAIVATLTALAVTTTAATAYTRHHHKHHAHLPNVAHVS